MTPAELFTCRFMTSDIMFHECHETYIPPVTRHRKKLKEDVRKLHMGFVTSALVPMGRQYLGKRYCTTRLPRVFL